MSEQASQTKPRTLEAKTVAASETPFWVEPGMQELWLRFNDHQHGCIDLPLGKVESYPKDSHPKSHNVLVPVVPLRYTTKVHDAKKAQTLSPGWLYVFKNGKLWRELEVLGEARLKDVNLLNYRGKDVRKATGSDDDRVLVPYKVGGVEQTIEMAYASVQWSWARIQSLESDAKLRRQRLLGIPLTGYASKFAPIAAQGNKARVENIRLAPNIYLISDHRNCDIPVAYLHDPLGVARDLAGKYQVAWKEMENLLANLSDPDRQEEHPFAKWFDSAILANQYFFGKIPAGEPDGVTAPGKDSHRQWQKARDQRQQWQRKLSKTDIDIALGTVKRAEIRGRIRSTKQALVDFLDTPHFEEMYTFIEAFDDFFTRPGPTKSAHVVDTSPNLSAWLLAEQLIARLGDHEYTLDSFLEADPPDAADLLKKDPGAAFLVKLADPKNLHPLHARLFPKPLNDKDRAIPDTSPLAPHQPEFNSEQAQIATDEEAKVIADFCCHFGRAADIPDEDFVKESILRLVRATGVGTFAYHETTVEHYLAGEFGEDEVLPKNLVLNKKLIESEEATSEATGFLAQNQDEDDGPIDFQLARRASLLVAGFVDSTKDLFSGKFEVDVVHKAGKPPQPGDIIRLKDRAGYKVKILEVKASGIKISQQDITKFSSYDKVTLPGNKFATIEVYNHKNTLVGAPSVETYRRGKAFSSRGWAIERHNTDWRLARMRTIVCEEASKLHWTARKAYDRGAYTKTILPLALMFESWNLTTALQVFYGKMGKAGGSRAAADLVGSALDLGAIAATVRELHVERLATRETGLSVAQILDTESPVAKGVRKAIIRARVLGAAAGAYSCIFSIEDMVENIRRGDDSAISHGTMAAGFAIGTAAEISGFLLAAGYVGKSSLAATIVGGPWGWVGLGVVLSGVALKTWVFTEDTSLEEWLANGPFSLGEPAELGHDRVEVGGKWDGHRIWTEKCWSTLRVNPEGVLVDFQPRNAGRLLGDKEGNVYLKSKEGIARHIGKVGQPFSFDALRTSSGRFSGHKPGTTPKDEFGRWYETSHSSYMSLMEAIYTPSVDFTRKVSAGRVTAELTIQVPMYFDNKSLLFVEIWEEYAGGGRVNAYEDILVMTGEGTGPRSIKVTKPIKHAPKALTAKVRMDLYDDDKIRLPRNKGTEDEWIVVTI